MQEIEYSQNITKLIYQEYQKQYLKYKELNIKPDFKELENLLFFENKIYSYFSNASLEKLSDDLTEKKNIPEVVQFFDFFYCLDQEELFLNYRIRSLSNLEFAKRELKEEFSKHQIAYFPLCSNEVSDLALIYNDEQVMYALHLHNFLSLIEENEYLSDSDKEKVKFLSSYMCPIYERYFLKDNNQGRKVSDLDEIYEGVKSFMMNVPEEDDYEESLFNFICNYYNNFVIMENSILLESSYIKDEDAFKRFIYLSCYVRGFFRLLEDVDVVENAPIVSLRKLEAEQYYLDKVAEYAPKMKKRSDFISI